MTGDRLAEIAGRIGLRPGLEPDGPNRYRMTGLDPFTARADLAALIAEVRRLRDVVESIMEIALGRDGMAGTDPHSQVELIRDRLAFEPDGPGEVETRAVPTRSPLAAPFIMPEPAEGNRDIQDWVDRMVGQLSDTHWAAEERRLADEYASRAGVPTPIGEFSARRDEAHGLVVVECVGADGQPYRFTVNPWGHAMQEARRPRA